MIRTMLAIAVLAGAAGCATKQVPWTREDLRNPPVDAVIVRGEVRGWQAEVPFRKGLTLGQAVEAAGGLTRFSTGVGVQRNQAKVLDVRDRRRLLTPEILDFPLQVGDIVVVKRMLD